jgi:DNA repair protein RadC
MPPTDVADSTPLSTTVYIREVAVRYRPGRGTKAPAIMRAAREAVDFARRVVRDDAREHFLAIYLDGRHRPIAHQVVSIGTATASLIHPREIFQPALLVGAVAILVAHNHPSGDPAPSAEDQAVTDRLRRAGDLLGVSVLDSIVWTSGGAYCSFRETDRWPEKL